MLLSSNVLSSTASQGSQRAILCGWLETHAMRTLHDGMLSSGWDALMCHGATRISTPAPRFSTL